jgi:methyltransferase-like protein/SAM-dependent methyltransferase
MSTSAATTYDDLPYSNNPFFYTHPDNLAVLPTLLGMTPAPVEGCRVLELGCGLGGNLLPLAELLPEARFVGIDLSARQIEAGQEMIQALGLRNIELKAQSITDVDKGLGEFDYIICHGVFSWVPPPIQEAILNVCQQNLAPQGIAYVSYNTYPGWHFRGMVRDMMRFHVQQFDGPQEKIQQARALMGFLVGAVSKMKIYGDFLIIEQEMLAKHSDTYLFHEYLEEVNQPLYFHEFAERAAARGLQYVGEATPDILPQNLGPEVLPMLHQLAPDLVHAEQYLDFLRNRIFRRSLLCHQQVQLRRPVSETVMQSLRVSTLINPTSEPAADADRPGSTFRTLQGASLTTNNPFLAAALQILADCFPCSLPFAELWQATLTRVRRDGVPTETDPAPSVLAQPLLQCFLSDMVELHVWEPPLVLQPGPQPLASRLSRLQSKESDGMTSLRHRKMRMEDLDRFVLAHLDGTRDTQALIRILTEAAVNGAIGIQGSDGRLLSPEEIRGVLEQALPASLQRLGRAGYLMR